MPRGPAPGPHHLQVGTLLGKLVEQELLIAPGLNPEVVLRPPAAAAGR